VAWHQDEDYSGGNAERPDFQAALERLRAGDSEGLVVMRVDRFARSVADGAAIVRDITDRGQVFASPYGLPHIRPSTANATPERGWRRRECLGTSTNLDCNHLYRARRRVLQVLHEHDNQQHVADADLPHMDTCLRYFGPENAVFRCLGNLRIAGCFVKNLVGLARAPT
jgi:Resolvase, N terminal domain